MGEFSLALNDDQLELRGWVHGFAEDVVRPAAAEWDAREETPWPIIQEAARAAEGVHHQRRHRQRPRRHGSGGS